MATTPEQPRLASTWAVAHTADEAPAVVRVRNLQTTVAAAQDAWGRTGKPQPALVSVSVSLRSAFAAAAADDRLGADTVHYGNLSKAVLASLRGDANAPGCEDKVAEMSLRGVLETVWGQLTGQPVAGSRPGRGGGEGAGEGAGPGPGPGQAATEKPFLTLEKVRHLSVTVTLPKASLLGEGVSLTASAVFGNALEEGVVRLEAFGFALRLCNLRIPTLIGVNANERKAKQFVVANVEVDKFDHHPDIYTRLESMVVKVREHSEYPPVFSGTECSQLAVNKDYRIFGIRNPRGLGGQACRRHMLVGKTTTCPALADSCTSRKAFGGPLRRLPRGRDQGFNRLLVITSR